MKRRNAPSEIIDLADQLGLNAATDPVDSILRHCRTRIDHWVADAGGVTGIADLEALVMRRLQMVFEEIRSDGDFDRITEQYAKGTKDFVFATMRMRFDEADNPLYGVLVQRKVSPDAPDRFVAVIDCRGNKQSRRFFTRWHEIARRLTTHADGGDQEPAYRSEHDPLERLMDEIAGHIGFYEPLFDPAFHRATEGKPMLTFSTVESIISGAFPAASFQATLFACSRRMTTPVVYLEATLAHKKEMRQQLSTPSLFGDDPPPGELRAVKVVPNAAAKRDGFVIPTNMRVPAESVIARLFDADQQTTSEASENLCQWESKGKPLKRRDVVVEGRKVADRVIAIVLPVGERTSKAHQRHNELFGSIE